MLIFLYIYEILCFECLFIFYYLIFFLVGIIVINQGGFADIMKANKLAKEQKEKAAALGQASSTGTQLIV